jgi:hypothetical protein
MKKNIKTGRTHLTFIFALFVILIIFCLFIFRFYQAYQARLWNYESVFIVFNSKNLTIDIYSPQKEEIKTYVLPKDALVEVPNGYGYYKLKDTFDLSEVEKKGEKLVSESVSNTFGIPLDATYETLNEWDKLLLWYAKMKYKKENQSTVFDDAPIFSTEIRIDGETTQKIDPDKVDRFLGHDIWEKAITDENLAIGIFNASAEPNIANTLSRKLEKIGAHIIEVDNWKDTLSNTCEIRTHKQYILSYTVKRLQRLFDCAVSNEESNARFDIMILTSTVL